MASQILKKQGTSEYIVECIADVFIYLWQHPMEYDQSRGKLKSWLVIITPSKAIDKLRRITKHKKCPVDDVIISSHDDSLETLLRNESYDIYIEYQVEKYDGNWAAADITIGVKIYTEDGTVLQKTILIQPQVMGPDPDGMGSVRISVLDS